MPDDGAQTSGDKMIDQTQPKTYRKNFSRVLLRAETRGMVAVASMGPEGMHDFPVIYAPRSKGDPKPWRPVDIKFACYRLSGRECHAVNICGARFVDQTPCGKPMGHADRGDKLHRPTYNAA